MYTCTLVHSDTAHNCRVGTVRLTSTAAVLLPVTMEEHVLMSQMASTCVLVLQDTPALTVRQLTTVSPLLATIKAPVL